VQLFPLLLTQQWKRLLMPSNKDARNEKDGVSPAFFMGILNALCLAVTCN